MTSSREQHTVGETTRDPVPKRPRRISPRRAAARGASAISRKPARWVACVIAGLVPVAVSAQTAMAGNSVVSVPSGPAGNVSGPPVPPGWRVVVVQPPAGSPSISQDGQQQSQLPPGATGASFSLLSQGSNASTVPSTALYQAPPSAVQASRARPASAVSWRNAGAHRTTGVRAHAAGVDSCELYADAPYAPGGSKIDGDSDVFCGTSQVLWVNLISTLYWWSGSSWVWQSNDASGGNQNEWIGASATHSCTWGTTHWWHTRADLTIEDYSTDTYYADYLNSGNSDPTCR